ncbi:MAG: YSC84-related protein [Sphingomonadaceae bacterium]
MTIDQKVAATLDKCKKVQPDCGTGSPAGYFVFPDVTTVALGVGGSGGEGALVENGKITGYYKIGEGSVGLQAGVTAASYVFKMNDKTALEKYKQDGRWSIGAGAGITIAQADADGQGQADNAKSVLYVFNSQGLMGDAKVDTMKIWRTDG